MVTWCKALKLDGNFPDREHGAKYIKCIMALALMNGPMIPNMFKYLQHCYDYDKRTMAPDVCTGFDQLFAYVGKQ